MHSIICPHCKKTIEISEAIQHEANEKLQKDFELRLEKAREEEKERMEKKLSQEIEVKLRDLENEKKEKEERIEKLMLDLLKSNEAMRQLKTKDEEREIQLQKKLGEEREKMKVDLTKLAEEKARLEVLELNKKLEDTQKALLDAQIKSKQTSQQLQGEVLELEVETTLKENFPSDLITPVEKGIKGADIKQVVRTPKGTICGIILWELKRTKDWDNKWIGKLKEDLRLEKAHVPIIVSEALPDEASSGFGNKDGVFVCSFSLILPVAQVLRQQLIAVAREKFISQNSANKAKSEEVYEYIVSHEFSQQIESMVEIYKEMTMQIVKEKAAFEKLWKAREQQVDKIFKRTSAIAGSLQGIVGSSFPQIKGLDVEKLLED